MPVKHLADCDTPCDEVEMTDLFDIPHSRCGINIPIELLDDLLPGLGTNHQRAAGEVKRGRVLLLGDAVKQGAYDGSSAPCHKFKI